MGLKKNKGSFAQEFFLSDNKWVLVVVALIYGLSIFLGFADEDDSGAGVIAVIATVILAVDIAVIWTGKGEVN